MSKRLIIYLNIFVLSLIFTGCAANCKYSSIQPQENIQKMEIIYVSDAYGSRFEDCSNAQVVQIIGSDQWGQVLSDFKSISCSEEFIDPTFSTFGAVIRITYLDGTIELLGDCAIAVYKQGDWNLTSHILSYDEYIEFINRYTRQEDGLREP